MALKLGNLQYFIILNGKFTLNVEKCIKTDSMDIDF